jgi:D-3-phosphoglycerate dehydrogenase / 2-oxoglutarate reductase
MDLKDCRILVTATSYGKNDPQMKANLEAQVGEVVYNKTGRPLSSAQLAELLPEVDGLIAGLDVIDQNALQSTSRLKVISRYGAGLDNVDLELARQMGITVTYTPGANAIAVAELAVTLILALARQLPQAVAASRRGEWPRLIGMSLQGKTVGVIGLGAIGKQLAIRLAGFGCRIAAYDPLPDRAFAKQYGIALLPLAELLPQADFISLNLPLLPETKQLVGEEFLSRIKPGAFLVNTARGDIIDEAALLRALQDGRLAGAALDVYEQEPPDPANPLLSLPNVIPTPHIAALTDGALNAMGWMATQDCLAVLRGEEPRYRVV